ncbi:GNAT family N-acetyltransferase [Lapidilactobacillus wuchangensis]|uniref:GNAT family N-acetyltransferase n=1 Tax=Lapidilactobacillus wuchangensis TaxID=2486001 RepID=UPI000F79B346|nr:GNAT family N-acetyltransferase [Lapidilactobacillus wuchangensis]
MFEQKLALPAGNQVVELTPVQATTELASLLLLADEDPQMLARYQQDCRYWAIQNEQQQYLAEVAIRPQSATSWEIMNLAVAPTAQRHGYGSRLIQLALLLAQSAQQDYLLVGTGDVDLGNLSFYLHNGFRFYQIRPDFFKQYQAPIMIDGLPLQDMIVFRQKVPAI